MSNCNQCGQCSQCAPVVQLTPPPICPTNACEEYISSDCVNNEVTAVCSSIFTDPRTGDQTAVGYEINSGSTMTEVISALTSPQNCLFSVNYLGAALQYIGNSQILSTILCSIVQDCVQGCILDVVTQLTFNPVEYDTSGATTESWWTTNFLPHLGEPGTPNAGKPDYTYTITITDTTATVPTVYELVLYPAQQLLLIDPVTGLLNINFHIPAYALQIIEGGSGTTTTVPSGHTYETVITSELGGIECDSDSFTLVVPQSPECPPCEYVIAASFPNDALVPEGCIYMNLSATVGGLPAEPYAYSIMVVDNTSGLNVTTSPIIIVNGGPIPACGYDFCLCDLVGTSYTIKVTPVCSFNPLYCKGGTTTFTTTVVPPATCAPPDITNVIVTP